MKEMVPLINTATNALMDNLNVYAESNEAFDIHKCFGCFTMDVIASVAFGTQVDSQNNPDDPFVHHAQMFLSLSVFRPIKLFFIAFPLILGPFARLIPNKRRDQMNHFFISTIHKIIMQREEQPPEEVTRVYLWSTSEVHSDVGPQTSTSLNKESNRSQSAQEPSSRRSHRKTMSEDEVIGQAFVFLLAGYESSSNTLVFTCYLLALHPECQRRLQEEVDDFYTRHESPDYTNVQELKYLEMVISEALRMYPPGFRFVRVIEHESVVNGQRLPKGAWLEIPAGFLHHDPEHWPEPHKFIPERFTPEAKANRHPFVYLPFGAGPRNCVGMRLALLEIKIALVNLFHRFSVVTCAETKVPLELKSSSTLGLKNGMYVKTYSTYDLILRKNFKPLLTPETVTNPMILLEPKLHRSQVNFLDITVFKGSKFPKTGILDTKVFFKSTDSHSLLHWKASTLSTPTKKSSNPSYFRFYRICSQRKDRHEISRPSSKHYHKGDIQDFY
ncbi:hypothetical protein WMY93_028428 [Mugilogobius chulae]|uniref:Thromboxane-A synthase n=1 Tax=Mugilogobius chulae TaxID=88201 RepID=A0AAW0MSD5_9GOBI